MHLQLVLYNAATEESQRDNDSRVLLTHSGILFFFSFLFCLHKKETKKCTRQSPLYSGAGINSPLPGSSPIIFGAKW